MVDGRSDIFAQPRRCETRLSSAPAVVGEAGATGVCLTSHRRGRPVLTSVRCAHRHRGRWGLLPVWTGRSRSNGRWRMRLRSAPTVACCTARAAVR